MVTITQPCPFCSTELSGADLESFGQAGLAHVRADHPDIPYPDMAVRNFFEGAARMTGGTERLSTIGPVEIHPVSPERIDDWLAFFDFDAMTAVPQFSACYCLEPHDLQPGSDSIVEAHWTERRATMIERLRSGATAGYLAYVDGRPVGWVNASKRGDYSLFRRGDDVDDCTVGIACFAVAPPYQGHGVAKALLDRVVADAPDREVDAVEAYPFKPDVDAQTQFRGPRSLFDRAGFEPVVERRHDTVVRLPVRRTGT